MFDPSHRSFGGRIKSLKLDERGKLGFYLLLPLVFWLIPNSWFEMHPSPCIFRNLLGVRCPGCGMTRAVSCAVHGKFERAFNYNRLVIIVLPLLGYSWLLSIRREYTHYTHRR